MDIDTFIQISNLVKSLWGERPFFPTPTAYFGLYNNNLLVTVNDTTSIITFINMDGQIMMIPKYKCPTFDQSGIQIYKCTDEPNIAYCSSVNDRERFTSKTIIPALLPYTKINK